MKSEPILGMATDHCQIPAFQHWRKSSRRANAMDKFRHQIAETIQPEMNKASDELNNLKVQKLLHCITLLPDRTRHLIRQVSMESAWKHSQKK